jgi:D-xylose transport system substrate-binding protein
MSKSLLRTCLAALAALALVLAVAACGDDDGEGEGGAEEGPTVALLLPENVTARCEGEDRAEFTKALKNLIPNATVQVQNAQRSGHPAVTGGDGAHQGG